MSVETVTMYRVICDRCGCSAQDGDFYAWAEADQAADEASQSEWLVTDGGHFCSRCVIWDEEADESVPNPTPYKPGGER